MFTSFINNNNPKNAINMETKASTRHTLQWYKENYGVDPLRLGIPYIEVPNPYYRSEARLKLWEEAEVYLYKIGKSNKKNKGKTGKLTQI